VSNEPLLVDRKVCLEARGQTEVDVFEDTGIDSFVALARRRDRQVRETDVQGGQLSRATRRRTEAEQRQRVGERGDGQIDLLAPIEIGPRG
jgi:hypothetical protein